MMISHYPSCTPNYPEKPSEDVPQQLIEFSVEGEDGKDMVIVQCLDCGAFCVKATTKDVG